METQTQTVEITELARESNIPIYQTNFNPIVYSNATEAPIRREVVRGVEGAYVLHNILTPEECQQYIKLTETMGFGSAPVTTFGGMVMMTDLRNNQRVMWQTQEEVWKPIYERIKDHIDQSFELWNMNWTPYGLNERFRFYKYEGNQVFNRHYDGSYPRSNRDMSIFTLIVYLTDDFEGGHTTFFPWPKPKSGPAEVAVKPIRGSALLFPHGSAPQSPEHEGSVVLSGLKYVLRSDIMYHVKDKGARERKPEVDPTVGRKIQYE